jgi:hypothetical protein
LTAGGFFVVWNKGEPMFDISRMITEYKGLVREFCIIQAQLDQMLVNPDKGRAALQEGKLEPLAAKLTEAGRDLSVAQKVLGLEPDEITNCRLEIEKELSAYYTKPKN